MGKTIEQAIFVCLKNIAKTASYKKLILIACNRVTIISGNNSMLKVSPCKD